MRAHHTLGPLAALAGALALLVVVGGCSCTPQQTAGPAPAPAPEPAPEPTAPVVSEQHDLMVYFMTAEKLSPVSRSIETTAAEGTTPLAPYDPAVLGAAIEALLAGPTPDEVSAGYASAIPAGTRLNGIEVDGNLATIDLSPEFESGGGSLSMQARAAQIVFTLTQTPDVARVAFEIDGAPVGALGGEGLLLDPPTGRDDYSNIRPAILVTSPLPGDEVGSPLVLLGESSTSEGQFYVEITDGAGQVVTEQLVSGGGGSGVWAQFDVPLEFEASAGPGTILAYEISAKDGSRTNKTPVPVIFD